MKKILLFACTAFFGTTLSAQVVVSSNFENWNATNDSVAEFGGTKSSIYPSSATQSVTKIASGGVYGPSTAQLMNTGTAHKRLASDPVAVTQNTSYNITFWAKGDGLVRVGIYDNDLGNGDFGYKYSAYDTLSGVNTWTMYTHSVIADTTTSVAEFLISVKGTSLGHIEIDSFVVESGSVVNPTLVSIYDIQYTTATSGDSPLKDQTVSTGGIVFAVSDFLKGYWIADASGAFNSVFVLDSVTTVALGDSITLDAKVIEKFSKTELQYVSNVVVKSSGNTIHAATLLPTGSVSVEDYESVFVRVENATNVQNLTFGRFNVSDNSGNAMVDDLLFFYPLPAQNALFSFIQGPVEYSYSEYKILPRDANDILLSPFSAITEINKNVVAVYPNEVSSVLTIANGNGVDARIISVEGKEMNVMTITSNAYEVNVATYPAGVYFLQLNGQAIKFVKK